MWNWDIPDAGLENHQAMTKAFKGIVDAAKNMVPEPEIGAGAIRRSKDHVSKAWPEASKYMTSNPTFRDRREYRTSEVGDSPWTVTRGYGNHGVHDPDSPNIGPHPLYVRVKDGLHKLSKTAQGLAAPPADVAPYTPEHLRLHTPRDAQAMRLRSQQ